ncbi:NAD+ synthase [Halodesulfurarchaeum formicicum]|uniref:NH(3)-dependent NAD(+) synthetase n=2 Tax=Halodesulfurarchaeum formicicum TaxID=1873524 RepID=A0A1D8S6X2_9EURY|nr:NAD+ synthase [Halodesulfurarchaeum formicicum]
MLGDPHPNMTGPDELEPLDLRFEPDELDPVVDSIESFIQETMSQAGVDRAILGLSGGIDSTTTAHLLVDALGPEAVHGLVMPGRVSQADNMGDAERVALDLGIEYDVIEIEPFVDKLVGAFPETEIDQFAIGNARARVRAVLNYLLANHEDGLVVGTGNRTEILVGYFTKYGDGAVDCNPIGRLYKQQVRQVARHLGVDEDLVTKTPTAGLWTGQTDEDELGIEYEVLDAILALHIDGRLSAGATARMLDVDRELVDRVDTMVKRTEHKRTPPATPAPHD